MWSNRQTWKGQGRALGARSDYEPTWPRFKANITIPRCRTVSLDVDVNVQFFSVVVEGTLRIMDRPGARISLRAVCILVQRGGKILAGEPDQPFRGALEFLLSGDEMTRSKCGASGRAFVVGGGSELKLYGEAPKGRIWGRLRKTADGGSATRSVVLIGQIDFKPLDTVVMGTSGMGGGGKELAIVEDVRSVPAPGGGVDTALVFTTTIKTQHLGVTEVHGGQSIDMRAEVGLYMRRAPGTAVSSITLRGVDSTRWDFRFRTMGTTKSGLIMETYGGSQTVMHGVRVSNGGAVKPSLIAIKVGVQAPMITCLGACDIRRSVIQPGMGDGIQAKDEASHIEQVVFIDTFTALQVGGSTTMIENVVFSSAAGDTGPNFWTDLNSVSSGIVVTGCGWGMVAKGNVVSGCAGAAWVFRGGFCMHESNFVNNSAHAAELGIAVAGGVSGYPGAQRGVLRDLTLWSIRHIAVWGDSGSTQPTLSHLKIVDAKAGVVWANVGASPEWHAVSLQRITIMDSVFVGRSLSQPYRGRQTGIYLPVFSSKGHAITPQQCGPIGGSWTSGIYGPEHPTGSAPPIAGELRVTRVAFLRFKPEGGTSAVFETLMGGGMDSSDAVPPIFVSQSTVDADSRASLAYLPPPKRDWINPTKCAAASTHCSQPTR